MIFGAPFSYSGTIVSTGTPVTIFDVGQSNAIVTSLVISRLLDCIATVNKIDADSNEFPLSPTPSFTFDEENEKRFIHSVIMVQSNSITIETDTASSLKYHIQGFYLEDTSLSIPPDDQLVARYNFDNVSGTTFYDSAGTNHGTANTAPFTPFKIGNGINFLDNTTGYATIPHDSAFSISTSNELTVAFHLQTGVNVTDKGGVIGKGIHPVWEWQVLIESGYLYATIYTSTGSTVRRERVTVAAGKQYLVVIHFTGATYADEIEIFLNNEKKNIVVTSISTNSYTAGTAMVRLGLMTTGSSPFFFYGDVMLDEIYFLPRALTDNERRAMYDSFLAGG
jgi:hypothetical protein